MSMNDLNQLLNETPTGLDDSQAVDLSPEAVQVIPESPTVLQLDKWSVRRGEDIAEDWQEQDIIDWSRDSDGLPADWENMLVADAHGVLFEPEPKLAERPQDQSRAAWWKQLIESPEYRSLHNQTMLQGDLAALGAKQICDQWMQYAAEHGEPDGQPEHRPGEGKPAPGSDEESIEDSLARMRSTAEALKSAKDDVDTANEMMAGLGMGDAGSPLDPEQLANYFQQVKDNELLRQILMWAGRMRRLCQSLQKQKTTASRGEITGVEQSGDVGRLVANELAQVAGVVPELELLAMKRLIDRRSLSYKHQKNEPRQSGPIVVVVDESGSMSGEKIAQAKGLAMAMAWLARHQDRWIALVGFAGGTKGNLIAIPPNRPESEGLIRWLTHFYGGGTTLDVPLNELPHSYWPVMLEAGMPRGKTDVILITDAIVSAPQEMIDDYRAWSQQEQVKTYGIIVGGDEAGDLEQVCHRWWCVDDMDLDSEAVEGVLSI